MIQVEPDIIKLYADIGETDRRRWLDVTFEYDPATVNTIHDIPNARFVGKEKGGPLWRFPLSMEAGRNLNKAFPGRLVLSLELKKWAMKESHTARTLRTLAQDVGGGATLGRLRHHCPDLADALHLGPIGRWLSADDRTAALTDPDFRHRFIRYDGEEIEVAFPSFQTSDAAFLAACPYPINANQPGLGKTLELIASVFEGGLEGGPKLVIAPVSSLESVWELELLLWQYQDVIICAGDKNRRKAAIGAALEYLKDDEPFWFITNPATLQYQAIYEEDPVTGARLKNIKKLWLKYPELHEIEWDLVCLDEFHQMGLGNMDTLTARGVYDLKRGKGAGMSGTPIGGKPVKLFGILHFLDPVNHTSKWEWINQWLYVEQGHFGKKIGDVRKEREEDFWNYIGKYMLRRTKAECLPWMPPKMPVDIWAEMEGKQRKQYEIFAEEAEVKIDELNLNATSILAEYTRLKQFSFSAQRVETIRDPPYVKPYPTIDSCKLPHVEEILKELGIMSSGNKEEDVEADKVEEQVVIFSQFTTVANFVYDWLEKKGVRVAKITGEVAMGKRTKIQKSFQDPNDDQRAQVIVMNTKAGGVAINLDLANTVIFLDETWNPDDQEQASDRIHRASRIHQVTVYYIRAKGTIEEYIHDQVGEKEDINKRILDLRRAGFRATGQQAA